MKTGRSPAALAGAARALADPTRVAILGLLARGERCVCDLTDDLGAAQSRLSFHLKILKNSGLIRDRPQGRMTYYSLRRGALGGLRRFLAALDPGRPAGGGR